MNQKKMPQVKVTLKKVANGFIVHDADTTVRIPKSIVQLPPPQSTNQIKNKSQGTTLPSQSQITQQQLQINPAMLSPKQAFLYPQMNPQNIQVQQSKQSIISASPPHTYKPILQQPLTNPPIQPQNFQIFPPDPFVTRKRSFEIIVPSCTSWFRIDKIHSIEKENFKEYFNQENKHKTPQLYKKHRNFIINLYYNTPNVYLTTTACRRQLAADACTIVRIHGFLNHWGIINSQVDSDQYQGKIIPQPAIPDNLFNELFQSKNSLEQYQLSEQQIIDSIRALSLKLRPICDSCQMKCNLVWYQQKPIKDIKEIILCIRCYGNNHFPNILCAEDFFKTDIEERLKSTNISIDQAEQSDTQLSDKELSEMLNYIQENPEVGWDKIAEFINENRKVKLDVIQILIYFLIYPFQKQSSIIRSLDGQEQLQKLTIYDLASRIASEEPQIFSDSSNLYAYHLSIFQKHLNQVEESKQHNGEKLCNGNSNKELTNLQNNLIALDQTQIVNFKEDSINKANAEITKEENKLNQCINAIINVQMEKIQQKIAFLEEYEKIVLNEKNNLEMQQVYCSNKRLIEVNAC
ncbi:unnamed protein product (macronuclear) [Paramecium tetraurelia]|uniref:SWIRM domain-containing protein n=1 Tax=Paramecium tetraurelia TaxID=5888 RepID=A0BSE5_PARTE|nr:uncharacterized protein GSPATT00031693001 [Paramecium tetraurelia]CAK61462.1 unnamed protein product [Paramecium tetraurelia]|eukprot:XP_001428860.1 hypothetical protein (macronuclear) [Paramecium tetraurelia strain d4-2]